MRLVLKSLRHITYLKTTKICEYHELSKVDDYKNYFKNLLNDI